MPRGESKGLFFKKIPYLVKKNKKLFLNSLSVSHTHIHKTPFFSKIKSPTTQLRPIQVFSIQNHYDIILRKLLRYKFNIKLEPILMQETIQIRIGPLFPKINPKTIKKKKERKDNTHDHTKLIITQPIAAIIGDQSTKRLKPLIKQTKLLHQ